MEGNNEIGDRIVRRIIHSESVKFGSLVGGNPTTPDRWKSHVMVHTFLRENITHIQSHWCGGVLLSPRYVLTSVGCVEA